MKKGFLITEEEKKQIKELHESFTETGIFSDLKKLINQLTTGGKKEGTDFMKKFEEIFSKNKPKKLQPSKDDLPENIVIGDSQSPYVSNGSDSFELISTQGSESSLWLGGKTLSWLLSAVKKHPGSDNVKNIAICIGTNGAFNSGDDISGLVSELESKFPNAKLFVVQGSWGWGGLKNMTEKKVRDYYKKFENNGVAVIEPPIGKIEPHGNKPVYKVIGKKLDNSI
jgi:hypothetical protein